MARRLLLIVAIGLAIGLVVLAIWGIPKLITGCSTPTPQPPTIQVDVARTTGTPLPTIALATAPLPADPLITPNLPQNPGKVVMVTAQPAGGVVVQGNVEAQVAELVLVNETDQVLVAYLPGEPSPITLSGGMSAERQLPPGTYEIRILIESTGAEWLSETVELPNLTRVMIPLSYPSLTFSNEGDAALAVTLQPAMQDIALSPGEARTLTLLPGRYEYTTIIQASGQVIGTAQVDLESGGAYTISLGVTGSAPEEQPSAAAMPSLVIETQTAYTLTVKLTGLEDAIILPPLTISPRLELPSGEYELQVTISGADEAQFTDYIILEPGATLTQTYELGGD